MREERSILWGNKSQFKTGENYNSQQESKNFLTKICFHGYQLCFWLETTFSNYLCLEIAYAY